MFRILDHTKQKYSDRNRQFANLGYWGALGSLAYPFVLYGLRAIASPHIIRAISDYILFSLFVVCFSSVLFGVFAIRADGWKRFVGIVAAGLAVCANLFLLGISSLV